MFKGIKSYNNLINNIHKYNKKSVIYRFSTNLTNQQQPQPQPQPQHQQQQHQQKNQYEVAEKFLPGKCYEDFECVKTKFFTDFNMIGYLFKHSRLNTEYMHLHRNDSNNLFSINFRTTPFDSTGIPHILEHLCMCGSERYPIKDPFFKMLNRSISTLMNAFTGPDCTFYPFSTMNEIDFRNLQKIYLDAVFKPNLRYLDFLQEGWHLENIDINNPDSKYHIKGVVYNEMKGAFSENSQLFAQKFLNTILPDNTYRYSSGGDPNIIPNLTHHDLVKFYKRYYHPSNARFLSYGNFNILPTFRYINQEYFAEYKEPINIAFSETPLQTRWIDSTKNNIYNIYGRYDNLSASPIERQHQIAIGYLMADINNIYETFLLYILFELMVKGPNSKFYKNLIEPNLSGGYNALTNYDPQIRDTMLIIGLQDLRQEDFGKIIEIFDRTIDECCTDGFDMEHVKSVLNNIELSIKHQTTKFGLTLLFNMLPIWMHGGDPFQSLDITNLINEFKCNLETQPNYLENRVDHYFRKNQHKLIMTLTPDPDYEIKLKNSEQNLIDERVRKLSPIDKDIIYKDAHDLLKEQQRHENLNILPSLSLGDIECEPKSMGKINCETIGNVPTQICSINTNNITYLHGCLSANGLDREEIYLLPILSEILTQMDTKTYNYRILDQHITSITSGIHFKPFIHENINDLEQYKCGLLFNSHCLSKNTSEMFTLINDIVSGCTFNDSVRFKMLLENYVSNLSIGIAQSGHLYAIQSASALITESNEIRNNLGGIGHIEYITNLMKIYSIEEIMKKIQIIANKIFSSKYLKCSLNIDPDTKSTIINNYQCFIETFPSNDDNDMPLNDTYLTGRIGSTGGVTDKKIKCLHNVITTPVNYCSKSILTVPYRHVDYPALRVLSKLLTAKYLLPVIREQRGAYGAGAQISHDGCFNFYSYRDPNTRQTLDTFDQAYAWLTNNWHTTIDDQTIFEAKLGVLQIIDSPVAPGNEGQEQFLYDITKDVMSEQRSRILCVTHNDLKTVADKYLKVDYDSDSTDAGTHSHLIGVCVLGPKNDNLQRNYESWTVHDSNNSSSCSSSNSSSSSSNNNNSSSGVNADATNVKE